MKKPAGSVWFQFYKQKTEKTEPKPKKTRKNRAKPGKNQAKTEKTELNRSEPVFVLKNRTETSWFEPVSVRFLFFLNKNSV